MLSVPAVFFVWLLCTVILLREILKFSYYTSVIAVIVEVFIFFLVGTLFHEEHEEGFFVAVTVLYRC